MIARNPSPPRTLMEAMRHFDPETAAAYVAGIKWADGAFCPKCGSVKVGHIKSRNRYQCKEKGCRKQFSLLTDTIFESTHLGLDQWMVAVWMIVNCRNGVSSCEIARAVGCKQQSAWHLLHRVRHILAQDGAEKLSGFVEADTTLVGGILKNMKQSRRDALAPLGRLAGKTIVHALKERSTGNVRAAVVQRETSEVARQIVTENVAAGSFLMTDSAHAYKGLKLDYIHQSVNHSRGEYVRGDVHTNGCESFFNCLRRGLKGTYIRATPEHLAAYVDEAVFRFNVRKESEWTRFDTAMRLICGKQLTYTELTGGAVR